MEIREKQRNANEHTSEEMMKEKVMLLPSPNLFLMGGREDVKARGLN